MADASKEAWNQPRIKAHQTAWDHRMRWTDPDGFERSVTFHPGFNSGTRNWGVASATMRFVLRGPKGATQFLLYTGWTPGRLESVEQLNSAMGADVGYHALCQQYEGQGDMGKCEYLDGDVCFYDGSGLAADDLFKRFAVEGEEAIWETLREWHDRLKVTQAETSEVQEAAQAKQEGGT